MKSQRGFTLVELMIVVVIAGILAAIAYPSYNQYVTKSKRSAAESFMLTVANRQEQYMLDARSYAATLSALGLTTPSDVAPNYSVALSGVTSTTYTITATPTGAQQTNDTKCANLTLNQTGAKGISGTGSVAACW